MRTPIEALKAAYHDDLINWSNPGNQDKINIALGLLSAEKTEKLTEAITTLQKQIPQSICELRGTISNNTDKIIESNKTLSTSNEKYAKAMKWLTCGLVAVGVLQVIIQMIKN